jgi:hypothetical protein
MLGMSFAGQGLSQVADFIEALTAARAACYPALVAIKRKIGSTQAHEQDIVMENIIVGDSVTKIIKTDPSKADSMDEEQGIKSPTARLPKYEIDSFSEKGLKPENLDGLIAFENVKFSYP